MVFGGICNDEEAHKARRFLYAWRYDYAMLPDT